VRDLLEITDDYVCAVHPVSSTLIEKHSRTKKLRNFSVSVGWIDWEFTSTVQYKIFCKCELRGLYLTPGQTNNRNWGVGHMNWGVKPLPQLPWQFPHWNTLFAKTLEFRFLHFTCLFALSCRYNMKTRNFFFHMLNLQTPLHLSTLANVTD